MLGCDGCWILEWISSDVICNESTLKICDQKFGMIRKFLLEGKYGSLTSLGMMSGKHWAGERLKGSDRQGQVS